jgi:hypothetical protein
MIWIALLIRWGVNILAPDRRRLDVLRACRSDAGARFLLGAAILTIGNTIIKPILAILTLPLIIVTFGLGVLRDQRAHGRARGVDHARTSRSTGSGRTSA